MNSTETVKAATSRASGHGGTFKPTHAHPLDAVPLRVPGVEFKTGKDGGLHLRRRLPARNRVDAIIRQVLRSNPEAHLSIDPNGHKFWNLVDGRRTLREIAEELSTTFDIPAEQARESVLLFTGVLMQRHFLAVAVPGSGSPSTPAKK